MGLVKRLPTLKNKSKKGPVRRFAVDAFMKTATGLIHRTQDDDKHIMSREEVDEKLTSYKSKFIEIEGYRIHYRDEGKGMPIVLLHGFAASLQVWNGWTNILKKNYRVIRLDMPGFALSDPMKAGANINVDLFTNIIHKFLEKLNIREIYLAGNSLGGWISWEFAVKYPGMVKKLSLLNAAGYLTPDSHPKGVKMLTRPEVQNLVRCGVPKLMVRLLIRKSYGDKRKMTRDIVERHYALVNRQGNLSSLFKIAMSEIYPDTEKIKTLQVPTLILWGSKDKVVDVQYAHRFANDIPCNQLIIYDKVGHIPMVEKPKRSAEDFIQFLESDQLTSN